MKFSYEDYIQGKKNPEVQKRANEYVIDGIIHFHDCVFEGSIKEAREHLVRMWVII